MFSTIKQYQTPLTSFAKAANAYNLYQLRITPNMVVVKRYAQQFEADLKKSAQASMITLNCQQGVDEECVQRVTKVGAYLDHSVETFNMRFATLNELHVRC